MQQEPAQVLALKALAWLAGDADLFQTFLGATGASVGDLPLRAADVEFQGAVLDFILTNDDLVIGFCDAAAVPYTAPMAARFALQGGEPPNWT